MLEVSAEFAQNITFNDERIHKALPAGYLDATTLADYLVKKARYLVFFNFLFSLRFYLLENSKIYDPLFFFLTSAGDSFQNFS